MSKTKKAVIIGSVLVGIGVIIGFIGIAIGGFRFPNGEVDLTTMKARPTLSSASYYPSQPCFSAVSTTVPEMDLFFFVSSLLFMIEAPSVIMMVASIVKLFPDNNVSNDNSLSTSL